MAPSRSELEALAATDVRNRIPGEALLPALASSPFIPSRSLVNLRDAGAVPGSALPTGLVFRCGTLEYAARDPDATAWLGGHVGRIFDLRKAGERADGPDPVIAGVENIWFAPEGEYEAPRLEDFAGGEGEQAWRRQYMAIARLYRPTVRAILEHVRDRPSEPFLFHCTGTSPPTIGSVNPTTSYVPSHLRL